jgi:ribosomal protein S18 acetylase RimI-like enzyme
MAESVRLRPAVDDDTAAVTDLAQRSFAGYIDAIGRRPMPMDLDYRRHIEVEDTWVALDPEETAIVGFVVLVHEVDAVEVDVLAVDPRWQRHGVGTCLLDLAAQRAVAAGKSRLTLYTNESMTQNLRWYPARGFVEVRRGEQDGYRRVWFVKELRGG